MPQPVLHIGDKNYSSWSMRPWLALKHGGIAFEEKLHSLPEIGGKPAFGSISPNARVPALDVDGVTIAESLAICEWAAEQQPSLWPKDSTSRALARAAAAIMHSGFPNLRNDAPMNIRRRTDAGRMTPDGLADAARVDELWREWMKRSGGPFLFGQWSVADAMYAPVVTRFITYSIPRSPEADAYIQRMIVEPHMAAWIAAAGKETRQLPRSDIA
ncbi:MAG: glutathione S-transferase [Hyphomonadaceae bacterium]|nr:glutathione S-transferase [Hyphomonadaceae bacterium]